MEKTQKQIVLDLLKKYGKLRTEEIKALALKEGVSCADRFLRWLQKESNDPKWKMGWRVFSYRCIGDRTKTWDYARCPAKEVVKEKTISESTRKRIAVQMSLSESDLKRGGCDGRER